jgi:hypothetical protein
LAPLLRFFQGPGRWAEDTQVISCRKPPSSGNIWRFSQARIEPCGRKNLALSAFFLGKSWKSIGRQEEQKIRSYFEYSKGIEVFEGKGRKFEAIEIVRNPYICKMSHQRYFTATVFSCILIAYFGWVLFFTNQREATI